MNTIIKAILFDIDDTLYDRNKSQPMVLDKIIQQLPEIFGELSKEKILDAFLDSDRISTIDWEAGRHMDDIRDYRSKLFLNALGISPEYAGLITDLYVREYPLINAPVDGAMELVKTANRRFRTGVISNSMADVQYQKITTLGFIQFFSCVVIAAEIGLKKPDPAIFVYTAKQLRLQPLECLYIGDNYVNDIAGAKGAGMATCWFRRGNAVIENPHHADYIVKDLAEAERIISRL